MASFTSHYVTDMDESMYQRCIYCGKMVSDYRGTTWPAGQKPPKGFPAGEVYIQDGKVNPRITTTQMPENADIHNCRDEEKDIE